MDKRLLETVENHLESASSGLSVLIKDNYSKIGKGRTEFLTKQKVKIDDARSHLKIVERW